MNVKRIAASCAAAGSVLGLAWVGGFNFNERGYVALMAASVAAWAWAAVYFGPDWKNNKSAD